MTKHRRASTNSVSESPAFAVSFSSRGTDAMPANTYTVYGSQTEAPPPFFATTCPIPSQQLNETVPGVSLPTHLTMHHSLLTLHPTFLRARPALLDAIQRKALEHRKFASQRGPLSQSLGSQTVATVDIDVSLTHIEMHFCRSASPCLHTLFTAKSRLRICAGISLVTADI
ncbi:hypothetical protein PAXINDRAFT_20125 [Paxillus involutus ATCC 200175]|uniref:Uncharacterized protein n=1 Tax=Paxillus involutus ATCC 200175 TaxID=664439 RepID=A0A0C9SVN1_PAXIN|nr:hypothetical protein PAXINDRAFT_20125 [Paxillus involutus ATCC 200175]